MLEWGYSIVPSPEGNKVCGIDLAVANLNIMAMVRDHWIRSHIIYNTFIYIASIILWNIADKHAIYLVCKILLCRIWCNAKRRMWSCHQESPQNIFLLSSSSLTMQFQIFDIWRQSPFLHVQKSVQQHSLCSSMNSCWSCFELDNTLDTLSHVFLSAHCKRFADTWMFSK